MNRKYVKIEGIHCNHCIETITNELLKNKKIKKVFIKNNIAHINYDKELTNKEIIDAINGIDYFTKEDYISNKLKEIDDKIKLREFIIIAVIILDIWYLINKIFGYNIFNVIPNIDSSITYGMLFVTGLLTSIHCVSMCGAINLVAIIDSKNKNFKRPILYNVGRVLSYTIIGGIAGLLGSVLKINDIVSGIIIILASVLMFAMSLGMLGIVDLRLKLGFKVKSKSRNPFIIGLLNGLMPCGPLQAMQVYALSTGGFITGALSMLIFGLGTIPLMLGIGLVYNLIKGKKKIIINKIASILILILSLVMLNRGLLALNIDITRPFVNYDKYTSTRIEDGYQIVEFDLSYVNYEDIIVQKGIPVKMIIHADEEHITGCNSLVEFKDFNITKELEPGDNVIEFTPNRTGEYTYTCSMNMIKNNIKVVDDINYFKGDKK